jgi:hypothetical protein
MADFEIFHEVTQNPSGDQNSWTLCFQWGSYNYDDGSPSELGYRFIWRRPDGHLQPARAQARIPSAAVMLTLIQRATEAGWFITCESAP